MVLFRRLELFTEFQPGIFCCRQFAFDFAVADLKFHELCRGAIVNFWICQAGFQ